MANSLSGRVIAVTGGARGIGREVARHLLQAGAYVAIGDRDAGAARATARELPGNAEGFDLDVTSTDSFDAFLQAVEHQWGSIDVLVNNAGVMWVGAFDGEPESAAQRQIDVNLHGVIRGVKLAAPPMRTRRSGQIVTIASAGSKLASAGEATYTATKHAVYGYLSTVRTELRGSGVQISVVMPAVVDTELAAGTTSGLVRRLKPEDVAKAVLGLVERPRFEVSIPRQVGLATRLAAILPVPLRDLLLRAIMPNQVVGVSNPTARSDYESRALASDSDRAP